jgi:hypothetical protein
LLRRQSESGDGAPARGAGCRRQSRSPDSFWSVAAHRPDKIEIRTQLDGKPVEATLEYVPFPENSFYVARTMISEAKKDIQISIDTFDYLKETVGNASKDN